ncbi:hypothetical protein AWC38_SpisGene14072 [Stylophora pistillata]|uniref:Uncharacterized protein n=1 Tax=Stylophora pistillata TaxID=50429 RepID=A0A2B4RWA5_STYPI|nr:hypothetical protein AWC38_SpisGene14072 [Stylophora pistillata]
MESNQIINLNVPSTEYSEKRQRKKGETLDIDYHPEVDPFEDMDVEGLFDETVLPKNDKHIVPKPPSYVGIFSGDKEFSIDPQYFNEQPDEDEVPDYETDDEDIQKDIFNDAGLEDYENVDKILAQEQMNPLTTKKYLQKRDKDNNADANPYEYDTFSINADRGNGSYLTTCRLEYGKGVFYPKVEYDSDSKNKMNQLIQYKNLLTEKRKRDILGALQSGQGVHFKPTKTQMGGALGTILASIGIPMAIDLVKNLVSGREAPRLGSKGSKGAPRLGAYTHPPPFIGVHDPTNPLYKGGAVDIHKLISKLPKPKGGWTPGSYNYMGPYNPLHKQLEYDKNTGEVTKWHVKPYNQVDEIATDHA